MQRNFALTFLTIRQVRRLTCLGLCLFLYAATAPACDRPASDSNEPAGTETWQGADGSLSVHDVRLRPVPPGAKITAAYLRIENRSGTAEKLRSARLLEHAGRVEIHESLTDEEGVMRMRPIEVLEIAAGQAVELRPGGKHLMLMELDHEFQPGETARLELDFAQAGKKTVTASVMGNE